MKMLPEEHKIDFNKPVDISVLKLKNKKIITLITNIDSSDEDLNRIAKILKCKLWCWWKCKKWRNYYSG
jgi:translation initiation factor 1 (eIF-1/SUI1)